MAQGNNMVNATLMTSRGIAIHKYQMAGAVMVVIPNTDYVCVRMLGFNLLCRHDLLQDRRWEDKAQR